MQKLIGKDRGNRISEFSYGFVRRRAVHRQKRSYRKTSRKIPTDRWHVIKRFAISAMRTKCKYKTNLFRCPMSSESCAFVIALSRNLFKSHAIECVNQLKIG